MSGQLLYSQKANVNVFVLTDTHVSSLAACQCVLAAAGPGVDRNRFADDKTILHQFTDLLALKTERNKSATRMR